jgi:hypothetical protein
VSSERKLMKTSCTSVLPAAAADNTKECGIAGRNGKDPARTELKACRTRCYMALIGKSLRAPAATADDKP